MSRIRRSAASGPRRTARACTWRAGLARRAEPQRARLTVVDAPLHPAVDGGRSTSRYRSLARRDGGRPRRHRGRRLSPKLSRGGGAPWWCGASSVARPRTPAVSSGITSHTDSTTKFHANVGDTSRPASEESRPYNRFFHDIYVNGLRPSAGIPRQANVRGHCLHPPDRAATGFFNKARGEGAHPP